MEEIVHIVPLGYEIDRAVKPFEKLRANRVYLLYLGKKVGKHKVLDTGHVLQAVKEELERRGIEVIVRESEGADPLPILSTVSNIIVREKNEKNLVYVNMSASGKLAAVAATLAAMYHDVKVYYVRTEGEYARSKEDLLKHGLSIISDPECSFLTNFTIDIPSGAKSTFLVELYNKKRMTVNDILRMIQEGRLKGFEDLVDGTRTASNLLVRINRGLLDELENNGYVTIERQGRHKVVHITDKGRYAACLIGST